LSRRRFVRRRFVCATQFHIFRAGSDPGLCNILRLHFLRATGGRHCHRQEKESQLYFYFIFNILIFFKTGFNLQNSFNVKQSYKYATTCYCTRAKKDQDVSLIIFFGFSPVIIYRKFNADKWQFDEHMSTLT
jgi:hypothetical protein